MRDVAYFLNNTKEVGECKEWLGAVNADGYPRVSWKGYGNGKLHRIIFELSTGQSPEGFLVRHVCDNPLCIRPEHLVLGSPQDNMKDRQERGRTHNQVGQEEIQGTHELRGQGLTYREVGERLNIHWRRVDYIINKLSPK